jgi:hypothetical protein
LIFNKGAQNTQWRNYSLFNKCYWENWISTCRRLKLDPCLSPCNKIDSKWIKDLNVKPETTTGSSRKYTGTFRHGNNFLSITQKAQHLRERINKWDCIKLKSFCTAKKAVTRLRSCGRNSLPAIHLIRN